jgi:hypothetical protein
MGQRTFGFLNKTGQQRSSLFGVILFIILIVAVAFVWFLITNFFLVVRVNFLVQSSGEGVDGSVSLNNIQLGNTEDGTIKIKKDDFNPGILVISGSYNNKQYTYSYIIEEEDIGYDIVNIVIPDSVFA